MEKIKSVISQYLPKFGKYLLIVIFLVIINLVFATITYFAFRNQIANVNTFVDNFYLGASVLTFTNKNDALTQGSELWLTFYIILTYSFVFFSYVI
jgi:hypothetical protein